jgi:hypothetical protein
MPQSVLPSGGQVGTGITRLDVIDDAAMDLGEAEEVWVEATAPVRARTTTNARTMVFIIVAPWGKPSGSVRKIVLDFPAEVTIRCDLT